MNFANEAEILTYDMTGISKMYVLYNERPVYVPNVPFHDRGDIQGVHRGIRQYHDAG